MEKPFERDARLQKPIPQETRELVRGVKEVQAGFGILRVTYTFKKFACWDGTPL